MAKNVKVIGSMRYFEKYKETNGDSPEITKNVCYNFPEDRKCVQLFMNRVQTHIFFLLAGIMAQR